MRRVGGAQYLGPLLPLDLGQAVVDVVGRHQPEGAVVMLDVVPGKEPLAECLGVLIGAEPGRIVLIAVNTTLAAASATLTAAIITRVRFGKPDASLSANGWVSGLVASSAACALISPAAAVMIGLAAGALVTYAVELFELRLALDDPGGAISVHAIGGIWGILALGFFAHFPIGTLNNVAGGTSSAAGNGAGQWLAQLVGIATLLGFVLPLTYGFNWLLNRIYPQRVAMEGERQGMDLHELGAGAYPEFITHTEEFMQR